MIKHDLIEQVGGIEKAKAIVEGAPEGATGINYVDDDEYNTYVITKPEWSVINKHAYWHVDALTGSGCWKSMANVFGSYDLLLGLIELNDLRTAITQHNSLSNSSENEKQSDLPIVGESRKFKVGDWVVSDMGSDNLFKVCFIDGDLARLKSIQFDHVYSLCNFRHATPSEIKAGHRIDKQLESDDVKDITNHISPNTKVINHG